MRKGLTLLECLVAIFIVAVGLIGVMALIVVAHRDVQETREHSFVGAAGRAAWEEVKIRSLLESSEWMVFNKGYMSWEPVDHEPFCIDPLFVAHQIQLLGKYTRIGRFPFTDYTRDNRGSEMGVPIQRATLRQWPGSIDPMYRQQAERIFCCEDDILFDVNDDGQQLTMTPITEDGETIAARRQFSWLVTVMKSGEHEELYDCSVVVFRDRPFAQAHRERLLEVDLDGGGYKGGDITIHGPPTSEVQNAEMARSAVDAVPGDWMMLMGLTNGKPGAESGPWASRRVFAWYKILAAAPAQVDKSSGVASRRLTISGGTWNLGDDVGEVSSDRTFAAMFQGAAGVFQKSGGDQ